MNTSLNPTRPGQICKIVSAVPDSEPEEVYIVAEDPAGFEDADEILVVALGELQRNIKSPENAARESVRKDELIVVGEDLESWVASWNNR